MSKANRVKGHQVGSFPFNLLLFWVKPYNSKGERCRSCQEPAKYKVECYMDAQSAIEQSTIDQTKVDSVIDSSWHQCIDNQMKGKYKNYLTLYNCSSCARTYLTTAAGDNVADLSMILSSIAGDKLSLAIGCRLEDRNDVGKSFIAHMYTDSIDVIRKQFREDKAIHINLKG